jgi:hypothetical protein
MSRPDVAGAARLVLVDGATLLHPAPALFEAMLTGWRTQQESRLLAPPTIDMRDKTIRRFQVFAGEYPWRWRPDDVEGWTVSLRSAGRSRTTIRAYQNALAMFCGYLCDARYGWVAECEERFGEHPVQICHEWNTADHVADYEGSPGRRPFTRVELQAFFDHADDAVTRAQQRGRKGGLAAWRDSVLFKVTYAWGLYTPGGGSALWLTERGGRISTRHLNDRFSAYRDALGLPVELTPHCLRHSYVSHLVEDGVDPLFVQQQVGHSHAATTAIYTSVSTDYRNRVLRTALDRAFAAPKEDTR